METRLADWARLGPESKEVEAALRSCVHCGFCTAVCPTYQLTGDEADGPRGRIYLMKHLFEGGDVTDLTRTHLDRCLSCRSCETACPSGVSYHQLLDQGKAEVERLAPRGLAERAFRLGLRLTAGNARLFGLALRAARLFLPLLPAALAAKVPAPAGGRAGPTPPVRHARKAILFKGCVQPTLTPGVNTAAARVLDRAGISVTCARGEGCCGALDFHLNAHKAARRKAKRNIDAWQQVMQREGAEAVAVTSSGCASFIRDYGHLLKDDPHYAEPAARMAKLCRDPAELLESADLADMRLRPEAPKLAFHCPCTLQHAMKRAGKTEALLRRLGLVLTPAPDGHLCCGSAGTYSLTQPELSLQLRDQKMRALESGSPDRIVTANVGCQAHLAAAGGTSVCHWLEAVDEALAP